MNIRVADIQACYKLWRSRGAEFITEPKPKYGETRCYIRDPDGYIIEVGQSNPGVATAALHPVKHQEPGESWSTARRCRLKDEEPARAQPNAPTRRSGVQISPS